MAEFVVKIFFCEGWHSIQCQKLDHIVMTYTDDTVALYEISSLLCKESLKVSIISEV